MKKSLPSVISASKARSNFYTLLDEVSKKFRRFTITRNGEAQAVLIHPDEVASWEETLGILSDKDLVESLHRSQKDVEEGKVFTRAVVIHSIKHRQEAYK